MKARFALFLLFAILFIKTLCGLCAGKHIHRLAAGLSEKPLYGNDSSALDTGRRVFIKRCI